MSAKAWAIDTYVTTFQLQEGDVSPKNALAIAANSVKTYDGWKVVCQKGIFIKSQPVGVKKFKRGKSYQTFGVVESLVDLGDIDMTDPAANRGVFVVGTRNSILRMFNEADQHTEFTVAVPSGLFAGVYREENVFKKDTIIVQLRNFPHKMTPSLTSTVGDKKGNFYVINSLGRKRDEYNWINITQDVGINTSGHVKVHPGAIELPLKNIFDFNQWR